MSSFPVQPFSGDPRLKKLAWTYAIGMVGGFWIMDFAPANVLGWLSKLPFQALLAGLFYMLTVNMADKFAMEAQACRTFNEQIEVTLTTALRRSVVIHIAVVAFFALVRSLFGG